MENVLSSLNYPNAVADVKLGPGPKNEWLIVSDIFGNFYAAPEKTRNGVGSDYISNNWQCQ